MTKKVAWMAGAAVALLVVLALVFLVGRSLFVSAPYCNVAFDGTTYDQAVELEARLSDRGYDAVVDGQLGGPRRYPMVGVTDDGLLYGSTEDLRRAVEDELDGLSGGKVQTCAQSRMGD